MNFAPESRLPFVHISSIYRETTKWVQTIKPLFRETAFASSLWIARALFLRFFPPFQSLFCLQALCTLSLCFFPAPGDSSGRYLLCYGLAKYFSPSDVDYFRFVQTAEYVKVVHERWSMVGGLFFLDDLPSSPH